MKAERPSLSCPWRSKAPVRRRAARVQRQRGSFCSPEFFRFFSGQLKGLNAHEKLLMFYMLITEQMGRGRLRDQSAMGFWIDAFRFLHVSEEKMMSAFFGLVGKGIIKPPEKNHGEDNPAQPQEEKKNG